MCQVLQQGQEPLTLEEPLQGKSLVPCFHPFLPGLDLKLRTALCIMGTWGQGLPSCPLLSLEVTADPGKTGRPQCGALARAAGSKKTRVRRCMVPLYLAPFPSWYYHCANPGPLTILAAMTTVLPMPENGVADIYTLLCRDVPASKNTVFPALGGATLPF